MRTKIEAEIKDLKNELTNMGTLCERAIEIAVSCAIFFNCTEIKKVTQLEKEIDELEKIIENKCMKLLLQQNPFASDFRIISSALKMITDLERIGDQARDIAELSQYIVSHKYTESQKIEQMSKEVIKMLHMAIDAVIKDDEKIAKEIIEKDDIVDSLFDDVKYDIIDLLVENKEDGEYALDIFMVAKYLERIGDHSTNIAEWLLYSITGSHERKNIDSNFRR